MLMKHLLIHFSPITVKNLLRKITSQQEIDPGISRLSRTSVLTNLNIETCDEFY